MSKLGIFTGFLSLIVYLIILSSFNPLVKAADPNSDPKDPKGEQVNTINIGQQITGKGLGIESVKEKPIIGPILKNTLTIFFAVGGIGAVVYFVWGAVEWILSGGDKEKVANARKKMTHAIIGLVLLALSFVIIQVVGEVVGFNPLLPIQIKSLGEQ